VVAAVVVAASAALATIAVTRNSIDQKEYPGEIQGIFYSCIADTCIIAINLQLEDSLVYHRLMITRKEYA
jgi:hypothetical protein